MKTWIDPFSRARNIDERPKLGAQMREKHDRSAGRRAVCEIGHGSVVFRFPSSQSR